MFFRIVGILWIALGIWWIMRPQVLKRRFSKKLRKTRRKFLLLIMLLVIGLFFSASRHAHGMLANVFLVMAILGVIKAVFFFTSKAAEKAVDWWTEKPLWMWRLWALGFVIVGFLLHKIA